MSEVSITGATEEEILADSTGRPSTDTEHHPGEDHHSPSDAQYILIFFILAAITAIEVAVSYLDIGALFLPVLLALMVIKFFSVVLYFMHIKFDNKLFGRLFYIGLGLAIAVYVGALATFRFFGS